MQPQNSDGKAGLLDRLARAYTFALMTIGCTFLALIVIIMGAEVFFRYVLNNSIIWSEEMSRYLLIWITFPFLGVAYERGELISLSMLLRKVPKAVHLALTIVAHIACIGTLCLLVWYGVAFAETNSSETLPAFNFIWATLAGPNQEANVSSWWLYMSVPVGAGLLTIHMCIGLVRRVRRILNDEPVFQEDMVQEAVGEGTR